MPVACTPAAISLPRKSRKNPKARLWTGGSGAGRITPLVYNPKSDGPPVFHSGVWTGDDGSVQFVQMADTGNQGTDEGDTSQSDDKSRARSWWVSAHHRHPLLAVAGVA